MLGLRRIAMVMYISCTEGRKPEAAVTTMCWIERSSTTLSAQFYLMDFGMETQ